MLRSRRELRGWEAVGCELEDDQAVLLRPLGEPHEARAEEAAAREKLRLENELNDGYEMLAVFVRRFGKREEFRKVCAAIAPFLKVTA